MYYSIFDASTTIRDYSGCACFLLLFPPPKCTDPATAGKKKGSKNKSQDPAGSTLSSQDAQGQGQLVGYQIRFDKSTVGANTKIKFMTDGILLKEVAQDLLLRKYRVVILDEAHERNINTDVLLGVYDDTAVMCLWFLLLTCVDLT